MNATLKVGDKVLWRGNFGTAAPQIAIVQGIERTERPRTKTGEPVNEVEWSVVRANRTVLDLDNGSWCYGEQVQPYVEVSLDQFLAERGGR